MNQTMKESREVGKRISARVSLEEKNMIQKRADEMELSITDYLMSLVYADIKELNKKE